MIINKARSFFSNILKEMATKIEMREADPPNIKDLPYVALAPTDNADENTEYEDALDWALETKNIHNIALTGIFGAGKSSILQTYQKKQKKYKFLNISLATFKAKNVTDQAEVKDIAMEDPSDSPIIKENTPIDGGIDYKVKIIDEKDIEKAIVRQLLYRVSDKKRPCSRFNKLEKNKSGKEILYYIGIISSISALYILFNPDILLKVRDHYLDLTKIIDLNSIILISIMIASCMGVLCVFFNIIIYLKSNFFIKKITLDKNNIEFEKNNSNSLAFDEYLDEILYFFQIQKLNDEEEKLIVVFEDLDRFQNTDIFIRLRELNILINKTDLISYEIVFIYALSDNMFENDERTKFFDFIIPIMPIMNVTNSANFFLKKLSYINKSFLKEISIFISDNRMLNNICNEFYLYRTKHKNKLLLKDENMLSIIVYKNLYPNDFHELQQNRGILYECFQKKNRFIQNEEKKLKDIRIQLEDEKSSLTKELVQNLREIKLLFLDMIGLLETIWLENDCQKIRNVLYSKGVDTPFNIKNFIENDNLSFDAYKDHTIKIQLSTGAWKILEQTEAIDKLNLRYNKVKKILEQQQNKLDEKIKLNRKNLIEVKGYSFKELFANNSNDIREILPLDTNDFLMFLLKNNYVDEFYPNYLTYFYEHDISVVDMNFILKATKGLSDDYLTDLNDPGKVIEYLDEDKFTHDEYLNCAIMEELLKNSTEDLLKNKLDNYINLLAKKNINGILDFIDDYIDSGKRYQCLLINRLCVCCKNFWIDIASKPIAEDKKNQYLVLLIDCLSKENISLLGEDYLKSYIENTENLLDFCRPNLATMENLYIWIETLGLKFSKLHIVFPEDKAFMKYITAGKHFDLNIRMFASIANFEHINLQTFYSANLTTIRQNNIQYLLDVIEDNFDKYISEVFLKLPENINENIDTITDILKKDIDERYKNKIIETQNVSYQNIEAVSSSLWNKLFKENKAVLTVINFDKYTGCSDFNIDILIQFMANTSNYKNIPDKELEEIAKKYLDIIFKNNKKISFTSKLFNAIWNVTESLDEKNKVLTLQVKKLTREKLLTHLEEMGFLQEKILKTIRNNKNSTIINYTNNSEVELLEELKKHRYIKDFLIKDNMKVKIIANNS